MSLTKSQMLPLGTQAPYFNLTDVVSGKTFNLNDFKDKKGLLVMFICRHCPFVKHVQKEIAKIGKDYASRDVGIVAISANDPQAYPEDAPESLRQQAEELEFNFPYLYDETQEIAKAYSAACTPDFFLFDKEKTLIYRGQLDDSRPGKIWVKVDGRDLRFALDSLFEDKEVSIEQKPSIGCSIKWKPGNLPDYFK